jgi:hypothetical protein
MTAGVEFVMKPDVHDPVGISGDDSRTLRENLL